MRLQRFRKTLIFFSFMLFSFTFMYLSPYLAVVGTFHRVAASGLVFWGLFLLTSPLIGRSACAYLCPLGGLQDSLHAGMERPLRNVRFVKITKYLIWAAWVGVIAFAAVTHGGWSRIDMSYPHKTGLPPYPFEAYVIMLAFMLLTAIPAMILGKRAFCHYLCFFSPLNIIGATAGRLLRLPALRVMVAGSDKCKSCHQCNRTCPMSLDVERMTREGAINHLECISCGNCSAVCKSGCLVYGLSRPRDSRY